jgi:hypothetical protein
MPRAEQRTRPRGGRTPTGLANRARLGNNGLKPPSSMAPTSLLAGAWSGVDADFALISRSPPKGGRLDVGFAY